MTVTSEVSLDVQRPRRVGRTARALVSAVTLPELAQGALEEMRDALGLDDRRALRARPATGRCSSGSR